MMKWPSPLLKKPHASSSSDDEDDAAVVVEEEQQQVKEEKKKEATMEEEEANKEEEEEDENEEEEDDEEIFSVKKDEVVPTTAQVPQSSSSSSSMGEEEEDEDEEESDSESAGSDSALPVPPPPPPPENTTKKSSNNITDDDDDVDPSIIKKPITSSSIPEDKAKKPTTNQKPSTFVTPTKQLPTKRAFEAEADNKEEDEVSKRKKKKKTKRNGTGHDGEEINEMMKSSSNKLWSKDDEVVILKGLLSLIKKYGVSKPISELINELHENIKASLQAEVTNDQLYGKIRKLKQKYIRGIIIDSKVYELAKKMWGTSAKEVECKVREEEEEMTDEQAIDGGVVSAAAAKKEGKSTTRSSSRLKAIKTVVSPQQLHNDQNEQSSLFPNLSEIIESGNKSIMPPECLKGFLAKEMLGFIGSSKAKDLEEKWNKLQIAEAKVYLDRIDLVKEQVELVLDAYGAEE